MKKPNYDNALTLLFENKESNELDTSILTLEGEDLYRELAFILAELSLIDNNSGKKIISEGERRLLEESLMSSLRDSWKNLWGTANKQAQQSTGKNLTPQQQQAIQHSQKAIADATETCIIRREADWEVYGTDKTDKSEERKKVWMEKAVKSCVEEVLKGPRGQSIIGKLGDFLRGTVVGKVLVGLIAVGAMTYVTGAIGSHTKTTTDTIDDGGVDVSDSVVKNASDSTLDNQVHVKVNPDGGIVKVKVGSDGSTVGVIERDHGVTDLKPDQVQQVADNIIKTIKDVNKDPDLGGKQVKSITLKFHSDKSNTDGNVDSDNDGVPDSNDCKGGPCAETHNQKSIDAVLKLVKQGLEKDGITTKVKVKSEIGGLAKDQVSKNSTQAKAEQGTTVSIGGIDAPVKTVKDTSFQQGPYGPLVDNPPAPVPKACYLVLNGKKVTLGNGDYIYFYGKLVNKKIQTKKDGQTFEGMIIKGSKDAGDTDYDLKVLGGFTLEENASGINKGRYLSVQVNKPEGIKGMYLIACGTEGEGGQGREDKGGEDVGRGGDEPIQKGGDEPIQGGGEPMVPTDFLQGNRNMQLAYLASNFLPEGKDFWSNLYLKKGTIIPSGFLDAALDQGKYDPEKYLIAFYNKLKKDNSLTRDINVSAWLAKVHSTENLGLIKWVRNTRKGIGGFIKNLQKSFPEFGIGKRQKAKSVRPGAEGQAMGLAGESLNGRVDLINELSGSAEQAGFDQNQFMKNLPQFMAMLSAMYYSVGGTKLPYDKKAVLQKCKKYGCKTGGGTKYKKTKSDDYKFLESNSPLKEELNRIKKLMK
jgi:hypothetical protein